MNDNVIEFVEQSDFANAAHIKVIGVGGGGSNAVRRMIEAELAGVEFYVVNTDVQALLTCQNATRIQIGPNTTGGLGAGADPEVGHKAAEESKENLKSITEDADMVFITAGMGGGTGTGAAPLIASLAKESGALTIGVVTRPFDFEGRRRAVQAEEGVEQIRENSDSVIVIPNQRLIEECDRKMPIRVAFRMGDEVLLYGVQSISDLIMVPGEINLDFADVQTIMKDAGGALMGIGRATGDNRAEIAARQAIESPLLEEASIDGATGIIVNIRGPSDMAMHELEDAMEVVRSASDTEQVIFGLAYDENLEDELCVTVIATGFDPYRQAKRQPALHGEGMNLEDFLGRNFALTDQGTRTTSSGNLRQSSYNRRQKESFNRPSRTTPERPRDFSEQQLAENSEDVLDIPAFLRVRSSKERK
ncbi:MAG: cell division protein FtsZ [Candidatus Poribacteria bacterium]|nr:cell division protein FtsZ [Candidatus Poribacteria bacterium]